MPLDNGDPAVLDADQETRIVDAILSAFAARPPTIGLIGVSGTGKSSTINSMFRTDLPTSHVVACTKEFRDSDLRIDVKSGHAAGRDATLRVVDAPGLGEDVALDPAYLRMYAEHLERCDVILWVVAARNRAMALDQMYLDRLRAFAPRMVFGINQVDLVAPLDWETSTNLPSVGQERNIATIVADRRARIESVLDRSVTVVPYSAEHKWQLQELFTSLIDAAPQERSWMFDALKAFRHDDFLPEGVRAEIAAILDRRAETPKRRGLFGR